MPNHSTLVYSTETGRIRHCKGNQDSPAATPAGDGIIRIRRETSGRKGKGVTTISGLPHETLKATAKRLKQLCGSGGAVKNQMIEIQGDHRQTIKTELEKQGHTVKLAGG